MNYLNLDINHQLSKELLNSHHQFNNNSLSINNNNQDHLQSSNRLQELLKSLSMYRVIKRQLLKEHQFLLDPLPKNHPQSPLMLDRCIYRQLINNLNHSRWVLHIIWSHTKLVIIFIYLESSFSSYTTTKIYWQSCHHFAWHSAFKTSTKTMATKISAARKCTGMG